MAQRVIQTIEPTTIVISNSNKRHRVAAIHWPYTVYQNDDGSRVARSASVRTSCGRNVQGISGEGFDNIERCKRCKWED